MCETDSSSRPEGEAADSSPVIVATGASAIRQGLDPLVVRVWTIENGLTLGLLLLGASIGFIALAINTGAPKIWLALVWLIILGIFLVQVAWFPKREYKNWSYEMTEQILELRFGVIWQKAVLIPLSRLQHVDLHRGPLERHFGLSSLEIHTAGTKNASHKIPGLKPDAAIKLRDDLVQAAQIEIT